MACSCLLDKNVLQTKNHLGTGEDKIDNNMLNWECNAKYLKYLKYYQKRSKWTKNSDFFASEAYTTLPPFWAKLGYSRIKIDHFADSLLKLECNL